MLTAEILELRIESYISSLKVNRNLSDKSLRAYRYDLGGLRNWVVKWVSRDVTKEHLIEFLNTLITGDLKPSSIRRKMVAIGAFVDYCIIQGDLVPSDKPPKMKGGFIIPKRLPKTINDQNIQRILSAAYDRAHNSTTHLKKVLAIRNYAIIELLYSTGVRIGELAAINIEDISTDTHEVLIHGKGRKERMVFLANNEVLASIKAWLSVRNELCPKDNACFVNRYGGRLSIYGIEDVFSNALIAAGILEHATPHFLRHSFATKLLANGANIRDVQELLGHSSIVTTQIYTEVSSERKKYVLTHFNGRNALQLHAKCS